MESRHIHYEIFSRVYKGNLNEGKGRGEVDYISKKNAFLIGDEVGMGVAI